MGIFGVADAASQELSGMGGGGREREMRKTEKKWRTTEKGQEERKLPNNETNTYAKVKEDNKRMIRQYQE